MFLCLKKRCSKLLICLQGILCTISARRKKKIKPIGNWLYKKAEPFAKTVKVIFQMLIGISIFFFLMLKAFYIFPSFPKLNIFDSLTKLKILDIVSKGLALSTGIELAYMLFTDGPDEAIDPIITGIAAFLLYQLSKTNSLDLEISWLLISSALSILILFIIRKKFLK